MSIRTDIMRPAASRSKSVSTGSSACAGHGADDADGADAAMTLRKVAGRPGQPVEAGDHEYVAGLEPADDLGQLGPTLSR